MKKLHCRIKGFTLIEVIIVLVILAAMAALIVPSLIGYINKANQDTSIMDASRCVNSAQTLVTERYAKYRTATDNTYIKAMDINGLNTTTNYAGVIQLAEVNGSISSITIDTNSSSENFLKILTLTYNTDDNAYTVSYNLTGSPKYTVTENS